MRTLNRSVDLRSDAARAPRLLVLVAVASLAAAPAWAESSGCSAANGGAINAEASETTAATRQLVLESGDTLNLQLRAAAGAKGSLVLMSGAGAPRTLIAASAAGSASFQAPQSDTYVLQLASNGAASLSATCVSVDTAAANAAFLQRRKDLVNAQEPDRIRINRQKTPIADPKKPLGSTIAVDDNGNPTDVGFSVSLSEITAITNAGKKPQKPPVDFWLEARMHNYAVDGTDPSRGNLGVLYFGTSSMIGPDIKTGAMVQLDRGIETERYGVEQMAATGWMAGPYVSMNLGHGVIFDGRAAWGSTENLDSDLADQGTEANRQLLRAKLTGTRQVKGWELAPSVGFVYVEDAVRDAGTGEMQAAGTGKVEVLPEISRRFALEGDKFIEPRAALGGYMGFDDLSGLDPARLGNDDLHLKAEAGVAVGVTEGTTLQATGGVESSPASATESWSGRLQLNMPLGQ